MKSALLKISIIVLVLSFMGIGCDKEDKDSTTDLPIFKELPILYMGYTLENEETRVVKNQEALKSIFSGDLIAQIPSLQNINFTKHDVLVGENFYLRGISELNHKFIKTGNNSFVYKLEIIHNLALPAGRFCYGIIVNKLSDEAVVQFEVTKINE